MPIWNYVCEVIDALSFYEKGEKMFKLLDSFVDQIGEANVVIIIFYDLFFIVPKVIEKIKERES